MRSQVGVEYLTIIGLLLLIITPLTIYVVETIRTTSETHYAQKTADRIASAIDSVSAQGYPAKKTIDIIVPESVADGSGAINYTVVVKLLSGKTSSDVVSYIKTSCAYGAIPNRGGFYRMEVMAQEDGCVQVSVNVTVIPPGPDTTPPVIINVQNSPTLPEQGENVFISWNTNENADSLTSYSVNLGAFTNVSSASLTTNHNLNIGSFTGGDSVRYYVFSCDSSNNCAQDDNVGAYYTFNVTAPPTLTDIDTWQLNFDATSDFNFRATGSWPIKVWLLNQSLTTHPGQTLRLTIRRIGSVNFAALLQLMTDNGDGSYEYTATIPGSWNNKWALVTINYDDSDNDLDMVYRRVVYVKNSAGSANRPWKYELDSSSNTTSVDVSQNYTVKTLLYDAQTNLMDGEDTRITVHGEDGTTVVNNQAMTDNGDGTYEYIITSTTLTSGRDYRIQTTTTKLIGGNFYTTSYEYIVEGV
jgi:hypothetical protein